MKTESIIKPINQLVKQISDRYIKQLSEQKSKLSKNTKNSSNQPDSEKKQVKFKLNPDEQIISDPNSYNEENNSLNLDFIRNIGDESSNRTNREEGDMSNSLSLPNFSAEAADLDDTPLANLTPDEGKGRNSVTTTPNVPKHSNTNSHLRTGLGWYLIGI